MLGLGYKTVRTTGSVIYLVINNTKKLVIILYIKQFPRIEGYWHLAGPRIKALEEFGFLVGCSFLIFLFFFIYFFLKLFFLYWSTTD